MFCSFNRMTPIYLTIVLIIPTGPNKIKISALFGLWVWASTLYGLIMHNISQDQSRILVEGFTLLVSLHFP